MRILQLIDSLKAGGAERMCVNISNVLQVEKHEVVLCASRETGPLEKFVNPDVKLITLNKKHALDFRAFIHLNNILHKNSIELIHAHSSSVFWAVAIKLFNPEIKVLWHDHLGARLDDTKKNKYYRRISPLIDGIITVNEILYNWAIKNMKVAPEKISFLNNFPLLPKISKQTVPGITTIVCLANLRSQKDHYTLVRAINELRRKHPDLKLKVIFAGLYFQDDYYLNLVNLIEDLGLIDTIQIIGSVEDTAELLSKADIGVLSSVSEGLPLSLLEYGLAGLPVVTTNVGQCSEVIMDGQFGKLVPAGNVKLFAQALSELITQSDKAEQTGIEFCEHIKSQYGAQKFINGYQQLIYTI